MTAVTDSGVQTVRVELGDERSYPIYIGAGLLDAELISPAISGHQVCIVSNTTVAPLYLARLKAQLDVPEIIEVILPDGEQYKTLDTVSLIYDALLEARFDRRSTVIALGGGVVGDMAGYAAATYLRGINFIQVPTTLLSQVDSSVGGKTGVNHPLGKNMIGAFYQPSCVLIDTETLNTLPDRELKAGVAEVIKYGLINNEAFLSWLGGNLERLLAREPEALTHAIRTSCEEKAAIVAADERETGVRAWLNLGHTFGHAIEHCMGYGSWLHGEAVAAGMVMAADLSARLGNITAQEAADVRHLVAAADLPVYPPADMSAADFWSAMGRDKKNAGGRIRFVLLERPGRAMIRGDIDPALVEQTLTAGNDMAAGTTG